ncbi:hypothetical protein GCM10010149_47530 [Nonomuraea roseoviolacea subsp. roseoviolacea]|uniref:phage tail tube protein n=1 Tax=Nonomuraea roseoviolacea TaxID=103837 RepID=UPI0031D528E0
MTAIDARAIKFAPNGRVLTATANTVFPTIPKTVAEAFDNTKPISGWTDLGYVTEDGCTLTPTLATSAFPVWQSAAAAKITITEAGLNFQFALAQWDKDSTELFFGGKWGAKDTTTGLTKMTLPSNPALSEKAFLILWGDLDDVNGLYVPRAMISDRDGLTIGKTDPSILNMTFQSLDAGGKLADVVTTADINGSGSGGGGA